MVLQQRPVETFFKTIKAELIWRRSWATRRQAEMAIFEYLNGFYNPRRRHSALGWKARSPSNGKWHKRALRTAQIRDRSNSLPRALREDTENAPYVILYRDHSRRGHPLKRLTATGGGIMADFREALAAAEVEDFRFHDLRHTFATRLLRRTGNLKLVSKLLGHSSIETTARYAHVLDEDIADALEGFTHGHTGREARSSSRSPSLSLAK